MAQVSNLIPRGNEMGKCHNCIARSYCLPQYLNHVDLCSYESLIKSRILHKGDRLFQQGEEFQSLFLVHSGSFKAYLISDDGEQQITGFHFQGELLGIDGLQHGQQIYSADALETSSVCELPYDQLEPLMVKMSSLRTEFIRYASRELAREKNRMLMLGKMLAERKLAKFFLDISDTMHERGKSRNNFLLPMSRQDIGNYLSLAVETVCRILTRLQLARLISLERRQVRIIDRNRLSLLAKSNNQLLALDKIA